MMPENSLVFTDDEWDTLLEEIEPFEITTEQEQRIQKHVDHLEN